MVYKMVNGISGMSFDRFSNMIPTEEHEGTPRTYVRRDLILI